MSEEKDLIFNPIDFLHDNWGAPLPFNSSPIAGGGEIFGATFRSRIGSESAQNRNPVIALYIEYKLLNEDERWCTTIFCSAESECVKK